MEKVAVSEFRANLVGFLKRKDITAHRYFDLNAGAIYDVCEHRLRLGHRRALAIKILLKNTGTIMKTLSRINKRNFFGALQ